MKNVRFLFLFLFVIAQQLVIAQDSNLRAYLDNKQFYAPGTGNYLEIYFQFVGYSIKYKGIDGGLQGELAISLQISDGEKIVASDAYRLQTPVMKDSIVDDFYDVKRFAISPGRYVLSVELQDLNSDAKPVKASQPIMIEDLETSISASDIEAIEAASKGDENSSFFKSGYNMIPRLSTFYPSQLSSIPVYIEFYNTDQLGDSICGMKQMIINTETGAELSEQTVYSKHRTTQVLPILRNVDISDVPTGKYALSYTLISKSMKELTTQSYLFERSNDIEVSWNLETMVTDPAFQAFITNDSVTYYLESLIPISKPAEIKNIISTIKTKDVELQRRHIQAFWLQTSPGSAYDAWLRYKGQVQLVERIYANNFQEGFETDRGRVYLQYGAPTNIVSRETSPTEYPYEIWQYNKIGVFSNKRFVFYNPDLVNNAYRLLHSDMVGELKNPSWPITLSKRNTTNGNIDDPNFYLQDHFGGASNDLFRQY
ncbi:MAG: GWxTD domain-containing protein [Flavobacteriales bacterium]|jgi:GWxTD domain-containing protein